jgi:hypothetical protein
MAGARLFPAGADGCACAPKLFFRETQAPNLKVIRRWPVHRHICSKWAPRFFGALNDL